MSYYSTLRFCVNYDVCVCVCVCVCMCVCCTVCPEKVPLFEGSQGVTLSGHVGPPPLEGVAITVTLGDDGEEIHTATDSQGLYRYSNIPRS